MRAWADGRGWLHLHCCAAKTLCRRLLLLPCALLLFLLCRAARDADGQHMRCCIHCRWDVSLLPCALHVACLWHLRHRSTCHTPHLVLSPLPILHEVLLWLL